LKLRDETHEMRLVPDEAHLWVVDPEDIADPGTLAAFVALLSPQEQAAHARFHFPWDRKTYLVSHALVRCALSCFGDAEPHRWEFGSNAHGKPELVSASAGHPLCFNLSHTMGLVACLVGTGLALGIDAEALNRRLPDVAHMDAYFARCEIDDIESLPLGLQAERFLDYWTLKEAYVKARGLGLSMPLDQFWFNLEATGEVRISFSSAIEDDADAWQFIRLRSPQRHVVGIALRRGAGADIRVWLHSGFPLKGVRTTR
jgi:4'-phosphopantetheinyl transferase